MHAHGDTEYGIIRGVKGDRRCGAIGVHPDACHLGATTTTAAHLAAGCPLPLPSKQTVGFAHVWLVCSAKWVCHEHSSLSGPDTLQSIQGKLHDVNHSRVNGSGIHVSITSTPATSEYCSVMHWAGAGRQEDSMAGHVPGSAGHENLMCLGRLWECFKGGLWECFKVNARCF